MKLLSITLYRFGSFRDEVTFTFPEGPGLFFLRGINEEEPALEANGAGKSTLWNAICWCVFDRTVKGLRAGDVANWEEPKGARVELLYSVGTTVYSILRQHSPNKWLWQVRECDTIHDEEVYDLTKDASNPFFDDLRLALEPFLNCVLMGQGRPMFLDLEAGRKAELFSDVLGLDVWLDRSKRATKEAVDQDAATRSLERKLSDTEGQLRAIDLSALEGNAGDWQAEHDRRLDDVERRHTDAMSALRGKKDSLTIAQVFLDKARAEMKASLADLDETTELRRQATETAREAKRMALDMERWLQEKSEARDRLEHLADCPTCRQKVPREHRDRIVSEMQAVLTPKVKEQIDLWADQSDAEKRVEKLAQEEKEDREFVAGATKQVDVCQRDVRQLENDIAFLNKDLDRLEDDAERIHNERNPFASLRQEALDKEALLQHRRRDLVQRLDASHERHTLLNLWAKWFKEIRLQLINDSLQQLEIEVNSNVAELGLHGWELRFDVDKETASGNVTRGFNVTVKSPHNDRPVPWKAWSGGEGQRLRVAAQEGLADLIRIRTGADINLEVWDEPTEHLSGQGVTDLLDSLAARARREQRQIWVVDHRSLGYGAFADVVTVVKDKNGSHFERTE